MVAVLIAGGQSLERLGLQLLLDAEPDLTVTGEAADAASAAALARELRPDVALLHGCPSTPAEIEHLRRLARPANGTRDRLRVLIWGEAPQERFTHAALGAGADGLLSGGAPPSALTAAIRLLAAGDSVVTPAVARALIQAVRAEPSADRRQALLGGLTLREHDVLRAVAAGWSNTEIAERLVVAESTVKKHITSILAKTGASTRVQVVSLAYESGLVRPASAGPGTSPRRRPGCTAVPPQAGITLPGTSDCPAPLPSVTGDRSYSTAAPSTPGQRRYVHCPGRVHP